jgi:hypothetical protein
MRSNIAGKMREWPRRAPIKPYKLNDVWMLQLIMCQGKVFGVDYNGRSVFKKSEFKRI